MRVVVRTMLLALLVAAAGCDSGTAVAPRSSSDRLGSWVPGFGTTILQTSQSELSAPVLAVVSDSAAWSAVWSGAWPSAQPQPLPALDFVIESVVIVGLGRRAGSLYSVTLDSIVVRLSGAEVYATEVRQGPTCGAATGGSSPVHMVRAGWHPPVTHWTLRSVQRDCPP